MTPDNGAHKGSCRRDFLRRSLLFGAGAPMALSFPSGWLLAGNETALSRSDTRVALASCKTYGPEMRRALAQCFDLLGGIGPLVKQKTVTVKVNLTGSDFSSFKERPVGETYMTHPATALALTALLFEAGAKRVRIVESTQRQSELDKTLALADWDLNNFTSLGKVEFENTRNLGHAKNYAQLKVPTGGYMFSSFEFNHSYADTDVMVSLAKLKTHITAGVTLSMKNLFGLTPNSLYSSQGGSEDATEGRDVLHNPADSRSRKVQLPGLKAGITSNDPTWRVPRIVADICAARPIDLAIIDGITSMSGGEGPWCEGAGPLKVTTPGVLIVGLNPVSTDAIGTAVMGYGNSRAERGTKPFHFCDNHLLMAEQAGLGTADLSKIDLRGMSLDKAKYPYG